MPRTAGCPCASGLRYKHCCGSAGALAARGATRHERMRQAGLMAQRRGDFALAIATYDAILREHAHDWDVAHMRATSCYQLGAMGDAATAFAALLTTPAADSPGFWTNLGLLLAAIAADPRAVPPGNTPDARRSSPLDGPAGAPAPGLLPSVSVVMPAYMHAPYVGEAIASVFAQTRAPMEFIVIDDGSGDGTADCCRAALRDAPFPVRFVARENRGAAATLNQGIGMAGGEFIQLLNSDDRLVPHRIAAMQDALLERGADWGYSRVALFDQRGAPLVRRADRRAAALVAAADAALMSPTIGLSLIRANSAISSGNLMFRKRLWRDMGGFGDFRYNHDWDFCLRATLHCEPVLVPQALYEYRLHDRNTIAESENAARGEQRRVMAGLVALAQGRLRWPNPVAPTLANWGGELLALLGAVDALRHVPRATIARALSTWSEGKSCAPR
ncbi:MAG: glycosyltransferase [Burkholderiales bacterium]|nr:glycosyltransferase [Burkholderiales bacterium]